MGHGTDYGRGMSNIDHATGIRYGIIPMHEVGQAWCDSSEPDYGEPHCPECGNEAVTLDAIDDEHDDWETARGACGDYACEDCKYIFDGQDAFGDEHTNMYYADGYKAFDDDSGDVWVTLSPYYTRAAYCSPCAPGACHLSSPYEDGDKAYCFGHDWFEGGVAPYPVYLVADDSEVNP